MNMRGQACPRSNCLSASPGLGRFIKDSPMRKASKPASRRRCMSSRVWMPLSATRTAESGSCAASSQARSSETSKVRRSRLFTPTHSHSSGRARWSSAASCTSQRTSRSQRRASSRSVRSSASVSAATISRMASAPLARASMTWKGSTMKSLRRQGIVVAADALRRFSREPWKNFSSVRTESTAAPAFCISVASAEGSKSGRIRPLEGEAFLSSAMMAGSRRAFARSASAKPRGVCSAAACSSAAISAVFLRSAMTARVCARISGRYIVCSPVTDILLCYRTHRALCERAPGLSEHESTRRWQQQDGDEAFALELLRGFAHGLQVRARVVDDDEPVGVHPRQEALHLGLAEIGVGVGEEEIDGAVDLHLERAFVAEIDELCERIVREALFRAPENKRVVLAADDAARRRAILCVALKAARDPFGGDAEKASGLNGELRLQCGDECCEEFEHFEFGCHRVKHRPLLWVRAFGRSAVIFGLQHAAGAVMLQHYLVFL